jgi:hypothetical protein
VSLMRWEVCEKFSGEHRYVNLTDPEKGSFKAANTVLVLLYSEYCFIEEGKSSKC